MRLGLLTREHQLYCCDDGGSDGDLDQDDQHERRGGDHAFADSDGNGERVHHFFFFGPTRRSRADDCYDIAAEYSITLDHFYA